MSKDRCCRVCKEPLTAENSYANNGRGTPQSSCKKCGAEYARQWRKDNYEREKKRARECYSDNKDHLRVAYDRSRVIRKYGITPETIAEMRAKQNGICLICQKRKATAVDHCHATGRVRGLLCHRCNTTLGLVDDSSATLRRAAEYLEDIDAVMAAQASLVDVVHTLKQVVCVKG